MPREARHDAVRTAFLETQGYKVLRFWNIDVLEGRGYVIEVIAKAMQTSVPEPPREISLREISASPQGGGGDQGCACADEATSRR
jgi:hypothetical protein